MRDGRINVLLKWCCLAVVSLSALQVNASARDKLKVLLVGDT